VNKKYVKERIKSLHKVIKCVLKAYKIFVVSSHVWYTYRMAKSGKQPSEGFPNYGRTSVAGLKKFRKGKHYDLLLRILEDLRHARSGFAVTIPLAKIGDVSVLNLRSAIVRAASKEKIGVATSSDDENFYVWKS
jgi:hypothetical protein